MKLETVGNNFYEYFGGVYEFDFSDGGAKVSEEYREKMGQNRIDDDIDELYDGWYELCVDEAGNKYAVYRDMTFTAEADEDGNYPIAIWQRVKPK